MAKPIIPDERGAAERDAALVSPAPPQITAATPLPAITNRLLSALPEAEYRRLAPHLDWMALTRGKVLSEPGRRLVHVIFPTEGIVSAMSTLANGDPMETAVIGNEGMVGISALLEGRIVRGPPRRAVVQVAGHAYRMPVDLLLEEFERGGKLQHWLLRFTQALITQIAQIAECTRCHDLDSQVCRWLLQRLDRMPGTTLEVTQEEIANLIGVRREGVTGAARRLQAAGLVRYSRGHLEVLDRQGLSDRACECVGVIQREYARLLGP